MKEVWPQTAGCLCARMSRGFNGQDAAGGLLIVTSSQDRQSANINRGGVSSTLMERTYKSADDVVVEQKPRKYIVRRLTPLECSRLQGYPDDWSEIRHYEDISNEEQQFWENIRRQHAETYGKAYKPFQTKQQMVNWLNGLRTDSAEYKAYGNSVAVPCVEFVMGGIVELLRREEEENAKPVP